MRATVPSDTNSVPVRVLLASSIISFLCGIAILSSGAKLYTSHHDRTSPSCNAGYFGLVVIFFAFLAALPRFVDSKNFLVLLTFVMFLWTVICVAVLVVVGVGAATVWNSKSNFYLDADESLHRNNNGVCYDGANSVSSNCCCKFDSEWINMCTPSCENARHSLWAMFAFILIELLSTLITLSTMIFMGGCSCWGALCSRCKSADLVVAQPV